MRKQYEIFICMLLVCTVLIIAQFKITNIENDHAYLNTTMACLDEHSHLDHHDRIYICRIDDHKLTELANKYNYQYYHQNNIISLSWPITTWE